MVRGAGVPTLIVVRMRGFLLCYWSGCGGFLLCYWSGCGGSYFAIGQGCWGSYFAFGQGAGVPTFLLVRVRGFPSLLWSGSGGSYFALGQGEVGGKLVQLCGVRGVHGSMPFWSVRRGRLAIGQGTKGSIRHWLASRSWWFYWTGSEYLKRAKTTTTWDASVNSADLQRSRYLIQLQHIEIL